MSRISTSLMVAVALLLGSHTVSDAAETRVMHLVLITWKPTVTADQEMDASAKLVALKEAIPGIISITVGHRSGPQAAVTGRRSETAACLLFSNSAALDAYMSNPFHRTVANTVLMPLIDTMKAVDYDIQ